MDHPARGKKLGLVVNPVAGLGGRVGLKGSDGSDIQRRARSLGATPQAAQRAARTLERLRPLQGEVELVAYPGEMGEDAAALAGWPATVLGAIVPGATTAEDSRRAARDMRELGVALLLFAGGDGTARDVYEAVGGSLAVLGIPAGVKVHSAAFAVSPAAAGDLAAAVLLGRPIAWQEAEVVDVDEEALRRGEVAARLFGYLRVPYERRLIQGRKAPSGAGEAPAAAAIAAAVVERMQPATVYLLGPGTTVRAVASHLGLPKTLLGVDAVLDGRLVLADGNEAQLLDVVRGRPARIIVTPIGGQGYLFGRGNQPISPAVLRAVGRDGVIVIGTAEKIHALAGRPLLVDTGDGDVDRLLAGYVRVISGYGEEIVYRVST